MYCISLSLTWLLQRISYVSGILKKKSCLSLFGHHLSLFGCNCREKKDWGMSSRSSAMPKVSRDLKARIPVLFHHQGFNAKEICGLLDIKKSLVYHTLRYAHMYGVPYKPYVHKPGQKRLLFQGDVRFIVALLNHRHCIYIDEIQDQLSNKHGVTISLPTLMCILHRLHYSRKGVSIRALERDELLHSAFMNRIADEVINSNMLMFVNEAARNKRTLERTTKGWLLVGKRCVQRRFFGCGERFSILPILTLDRIITYDIVPSSVTSERFLQFLRKHVVRVSIYTFGLLTQHIDPPF
jgi:transposase